MTLYLVGWQIEVEAETAMEALFEAIIIKSDNEEANLATVFTVSHEEKGQSTWPRTVTETIDIKVALDRKERGEKWQ